MAIFGCSITKEIDYRGGVERFANVYHYETVPAESFDDESVIQQTADAERTVMGQRVRFVEGRTWGPVGDPITSITRTIVDLTGTGAVAQLPGMPPEACVLVSWPAGRSAVTGRLVFLRKWIRRCSSDGVGDAGIDQTAQIAVGVIGDMELYANDVQAQGGLGSADYPLVAASGRGITGPAFVEPWLESHDLKY